MRFIRCQIHYKKKLRIFVNIWNSILKLRPIHETAQTKINKKFQNILNFFFSVYILDITLHSRNILLCPPRLVVQLMRMSIYPGGSSQCKDKGNCRNYQIINNCHTFVLLTDGFEPISTPTGDVCAAKQKMTVFPVPWPISV